MTRNGQIDFVKSVMIFLMVAFHLVYIGDTYSNAKAFVYTFHMPVFLFLSGMLLNIDKSWKAFGRTMLFIAIPYAIMESGYILGAAVLPIREHIDHLTVGLYFDKLILNPIGPYWYLQTIIICSVVYKFVAWILQRVSFLHDVFMLIILVGVYELISLPHFIAWSSYMYFTIGIIARMIMQNKHQKVTDHTFRSHWTGVLVFSALAYFVEDPDRGSIVGVVITALAFCTSLELHKFFSKYCPQFNRLCLFVGRNTLLILLFSPIFTILAKTYQPMLLAVDSSGMIFMIFSVALAIAGSLSIGWLADLTKISPYIFGRGALIRNH